MVESARPDGELAVVASGLPVRLDFLFATLEGTNMWCDSVDTQGGLDRAYTASEHRTSLSAASSEEWNTAFVDVILAAFGQRCEQSVQRLVRGAG